MSRRSSVTIREQPVADATSVTGALKVHTETLTIRTEERLQVIDLTEQVMAIVRGLRVKEGVVNLFSMHTTCTIFINEFQNALLADIKTFLEKAVARDGDWRHNDPVHSDCDRMNADSHLRAMLLGHSLTVQVSGGEVVLGQWQRLLLAELDGPRTRALRLSFMGIS
ncbi:MAG TPA: secondary thiamine-phosphate synthase enzyme YjbQ [Vicinamibacterales bacterium]|nr:secondary thiamine-phosphate synthase enzyme YjbQ [Vicinamibacterales bacterium]